MLREVACEVVEAEAEGHGFLILHPVDSLVVLVGEPGLGTVRAVVAAMSDAATLLVEEASLPHALSALPDWKAQAAVLHELPPGALAEIAAAETAHAGVARAVAPHADGVAPPARGAAPVVRLLAPSDEPMLRVLTSGELREELLHLLPTAPIAAAFLDQRAVAFCSAPYRTETLWDVAVDTLDGFRRRGLATAAFRHLAGKLAGVGLAPVWGAEADNAASLALAARLGFVATDALQVVTRET